MLLGKLFHRLSFHFHTDDTDLFISYQLIYLTNILVIPRFQEIDTIYLTLNGDKTSISLGLVSPKVFYI